MALTPITNTAIDGSGVVSQPDKLTGTAAENKAVFDQLVKQVVAPKINLMIEAINGTVDETEELRTYGGETYDSAKEALDAALADIKELTDIGVYVSGGDLVGTDGSSISASISGILDITDVAAIRARSLNNSDAIAELNQDIAELPDSDTTYAFSVQNQNLVATASDGSSQVVMLPDTTAGVDCTVEGTKLKLTSSGISPILIDTTLKTNSTNAVTNKAIATAVNTLDGNIGTLMSDMMSVNLDIESILASLDEVTARAAALEAWKVTVDAFMNAIETGDADI